MLSVIIVNYNSATLSKECYSSIKSAETASVEFIIVDSGSADEDTDILRTLEGPGVRIILKKENIGYAKAVNAGIRNAQGDLILITNPDVIYTPDSIRTMSNALLELPACGAVGPRTWWNQGKTFLLPFSELVTPYRILRTEFMRVSLSIREAVLKSWIKRSLKYWLSEKPLRQEMLSGASIMTTRKVLDAVGGFDENFPLYFEDTDWCLRVQKAGHHLYMVPKANIVHYYNQSAKQDMQASQDKFHESSDKYLRKNFKGQLFLFRLVQRLHKFGRNKVSAMYEDMSILTEPPIFTFSDGSRKLLLLSPVDVLIPSAGSFFEGSSFALPEDLWGLLGEGRYFVKVLYLETLAECGAWCWERRSSE